MRSALSVKYAEQEIIVLDQLTMEAPKTKEMIQILENLGVDRKALIVTGNPERNVYLSARNIQGIAVTFAPIISVYDLLLHDKLIITTEALTKIEEVYADA
jgi:large subunit ribosomal protein L4